MPGVAEKTSGRNCEFEVPHGLAEVLRATNQALTHHQQAATLAAGLAT